ncbi:Peptidoglycan/LPS O-acetylase OafA/YrhL, contains acyltransferase and SGNH-hydrolase domains [Nocardioides sp. AX2bis]|nr:Peptidoglycan/LPS O-acetylase OafA/YrhL, contains acyltransferase and SGNH-hydrolase domains [Nocardioides sp. AX2bis]
MAVTLVLVLHAGIPLAGGFIGVDVFFVISGFLMTSLLLREVAATGTLSLAGFYARRAKRLLPAAATVLLATGAATLLLVPPIRWPDIGKDILASALYVQNWRLAEVATDYNAEGLSKSPLQHFWTLAVEEQYYVVWPVLLLLALALIGRRRRREGQRWPLTLASLFVLLVLAVPSLAWSIHLTSTDPSAAYFATSTRLWELSVGGVVAIVAIYVPRVMSPLAGAVVGWLGLTVLLTSAFLIDETTPFPGTAAAYPTVATAVIILAGLVPHRWGPTLVLGLRPLQWVGKLSYSLYLWHWPMLVIVAAALARDLSAAEGVVVVLLATVPAYLSFRLIEDPVRRSRALAGHTWRTLRVGGACTVAGAVASAVVLGAAWPPATPPAPLAISLGGGPQPSDAPKLGALVLDTPALGDRAGAPVSRADSITPDPLVALRDNVGDECVKRLDDVSPEPCVTGDVDSSIEVALVGDSHAAQWAAPLTAIAREREWRLSIYAKQNCTYATGITVAYDARPYPQCTTWSGNVASALASDPPDLVILSDVFRKIVDPEQLSYEASFEPLRESYETSWGSFLESGANVVVLKDTPRPGIDVPACVSEHPDDLTACAVSRPEAMRDGTPLEAAAKSLPRVEFINLENAVCPTRECSPVIGDALVYRDSNHLTSTYALTLAPRLYAALPKL